MRRGARKGQKIVDCIGELGKISSITQEHHPLLSRIAQQLKDVNIKSRQAMLAQLSQAKAVEKMVGGMNRKDGDITEATMLTCLILSCLTSIANIGGTLQVTRQVLVLLHLLTRYSNCPSRVAWYSYTHAHGRDIHSYVAVLRCLAAHCRSQEVAGAALYTPGITDGLTGALSD